MYKHLIGALVGALLCSTASAGYIQYDLKDVRFDDGGSLQGYFVQDTNDKSIAYYDLALHTGGRGGTGFRPSGLFDNVIAAGTWFPGAGPTSFVLFDDLSDAFLVTVALEIRPAGPDEPFPNYVMGWADQVPVAGMPEWDPDYAARFNEIVGGSVAVGTIDPYLLAALEAGQTDGINHIVPDAWVPQDPQAPQDVPEPASWALLVAGAVAARSLGYRRAARGQAVPAAVAHRTVNPAARYSAATR
jgi:hypothetical protein